MSSDGVDIYEIRRWMQIKRSTQLICWLLLEWLIFLQCLLYNLINYMVRMNHSSIPLISEVWQETCNILPWQGLTFRVNIVCQNMHVPTVLDLNLLKRILKYLKSNFQMGVSLTADTDYTLKGYNDSDWAGCKDTRRSIEGVYTFFGSNLIPMSPKTHPTVSRSYTEAENWSLSLDASELKWITFLLRELSLSQPVILEMYWDNL